MTEPREYLVRTPDGHDYGRDASKIAAQFAAIGLGDGAKVIALDDFLLPIKENGVEKVVYEVGTTRDQGSIPCPYRRCRYQATDENDLDEHLIAMPTEAPEHWRKGGDELPRRIPRAIVGQFARK